MATQTQIMREAPEVEALKLGLMESAKKLADTPIDIPAYEVEGFSDIQKSILDLIRGDTAGFYDPQQAIADAATGIGETRAGLSDAENLLLASIGRGELGSQAITDAMDPYVDEVIEGAQQDIFDQAQMQENRMVAEGIGAAGQGAFGSRGELMRGQMFGEAAKEAGRLGAQLRSDAFRDAQNRLGTAAGGISGLLGQEAGLFGQEAGLAQLRQGLQQSGLGFGFDIGAREQALGQATKEAERQGEMENLYEPYKRLAFTSDIYQGAPSSTMTTVTGPAGGGGASPFEKLFGYGTAALSGAAGIQSLFG